MSGKAERGQCPICRMRIPMSKEVFAKEFQCAHCGAPLFVPVAYSRALVALSGVTSCILAWLLGFRGILSFWLFALPALFPVASVMVRLAPHLVTPAFAPRRPPYITTLGLVDGPHERSRGARPR